MTSRVHVMTSTVTKIVIESSSLVLPPSGAKQGVCRLQDVKDRTGEGMHSRQRAHALIASFSSLTRSLIQSSIRAKTCQRLFKIFSQRGPGHGLGQCLLMLLLHGL